MEDIKAYIESGILELYVLGNLNAEEKLQVEGIVSKYPEVKAELAEIERALEAYALENAIEPPVPLRDKVLNSIITTFADDTKFPTKTFNKEPGDDYIVPQPDMQKKLPPARVSGFYKYAFAASLAALIASLGALYHAHNQLQESQGEIALLQSKNQSFANRVNLMDKEIGIFRDPSFKMIKLQGTKNPASQMTIAWSPQKKKVMIDMKDLRLASNDEAHQYQLWAMVDGKPVDLGVFDAKEAGTGMVEMKFVANVSMFAVTLEPRGGSATPTMDQMVVVAKV